MKQKPKGTYIEFSFLALLILCGLAVLGISAYNYYRPKNIQPVSKTTFLNLNQIPSTLSKKLKVSFPSLSQQKTYDQTLKIGYQFPGENYAVLLPTSTTSLSFADSKSANESTVYQYFNQASGTINSFLGRQNFGAPIDLTPAGSLLTKVDFYKSPKYICQITYYNLLDINCADLNSLIKNARALSPFVKVYEAASPGEGEVTASLPTFAKSQTPGYQLAEMYFYDASGEVFANFYRQGNGAWQMVNKNWYQTWGNNHLTAGGQTMRDCGYFDSNPITAAAFKGQSCYSTYLDKRSIIY